MYSGDGGSFGSSWAELNNLDRLLARLTRPSLAGEGVPPEVRDELKSLGLSVSPSGRKELVQRLWGRKRPLLRNLDGDDDPFPSCA